MTNAEALAKAQEKWGPRATAEYAGTRKVPEAQRHMVHAHPGASPIFGMGSTWEGAFEDAERRQKK